VLVIRSTNCGEECSPVEYINNRGWRTSDETSSRPHVPMHKFHRLVACNACRPTDRSADNNTVSERAARRVARPKAPIRSALMPHYTNIARLRVQSQPAVGILDPTRYWVPFRVASTPPTTMTTTQLMSIYAISTCLRSLSDSAAFLLRCLRDQRYGLRA